MKFIFTILLSMQAFAFNPTVTHEYEVDYRLSPTKAVDILFVIDNSGSMAKHQRFLASMAKDLLGALNTVDYQIAAISTDEKQILSPYIIDLATQDSITLLKSLMTYYGIEGSPNEYIFKNVKNYLKSNQATKLFRKNANTEIIMITDEYEQSEILPQDVIDLFSPKSVVFNGIIPGGDGNDDQICTLGQTMEDFATYRDIVIMTHGNMIDLCNREDIKSEEYIKLAKSIIKRAAPISTPALPIQYLDLHQNINLDSVQISYGTQVIPRGDLHHGWVYDSILNRIILGKKIKLTEQTKGTKFIIKYDVL